jgi:hypothetical protein
MVNETGPDVALNELSCSSGILTLPPQEPVIVYPVGRAGEAAVAIADARFADKVSRSIELPLISTPSTRDDEDSAPCCTASPLAVVKVSAFVTSTADGEDKPAYEIDAFVPAAAPLSPPLLQPNNASDENRIVPIDNLEIKPDMPLFS